MNRPETIAALKGRADDVSQAAASTLDADAKTMVVLREAFLRAATALTDVVMRESQREDKNRETVVELALVGKLCASMALALDGVEEA